MDVSIRQCLALPLYPGVVATAVALSILCSSSIVAVGASRESKKPAVKEKTEIRNHPECVSEAKSISENKRGSAVDFDDLFIKVTDIVKNSTKGEFEKTDEFKSRLKKYQDEINSYLTEKYLRPRIVAISDLLGTATRYNADTETISASKYGFLSKIETDQVPIRPVVPVVYKVESKADEAGTYTARNGFGAEVEVRKIASFIRGYRWERTAKKLYSVDDYPSIKFSRKMAPNDAKNLKENLQMVIVGTVRPPFFVKSTEKSKATFQIPIEVTTNSALITISVTCGAVFDRRSGEIIFNLNL